MEKRAILTVVICAAILMLYQYLILPILVPPVPEKAPPSTETVAKTQEESAFPAAASKPQETAELLKKQKTVPARDIKITTDLYKMVITNRGGVIKSWKLKNHKIIELSDTENNLFIKKSDLKERVLELVSFASEQNKYFPLRLDFLDKRLENEVNSSVFENDKSNINLDKQHNSDTLTLTYVDEMTSLKIEKVITFFHDSYSIKVAVKILNSSDKTQNAGYYLSWGYNLGQELKPGTHSYSYVGPISLIEGEINDDSLDDIEGNFKLYNGSVAWAALQDNYFAAILVPKNMSDKVQVSKSGDTLGAIGVASARTALNSQNEVIDEFVLYGGPKLESELKKLNCNAYEIIDYGWFGPVARPTISFLNIINDFFGNYGISIIILTIIIKVLFLPLTQGSFKSMKKMQQLQPKIAAIKAKYKKNPQKVNEETMALYRKHKVNPLGGCMPMVLQIPVFFALYKGLLVAIELRHSPFITSLPFTDYVWLYDLSMKDPYYITPVLMGVSMFLQQKMTPTQAEGSQAKIMMAMPLVFTFMFLNFPSGLVIYWLVNNILTIAQQALINKSND